MNQAGKGDRLSDALSICHISDYPFGNRIFKVASEQEIGGIASLLPSLVSAIIAAALEQTYGYYHY